MTRHLTAVICVLMFVSSAFSLPRFALMAGAKCASCHINPTGGLMRTEYGIGYSTEKVPLEALKDTEFTFSGKLNDNISLGGDYRSQFIYDGFSKSTTFQAMTTSIYGAVTLSKKITFFFKQDLVNGTSYTFSPNPNFFGGPEVYGIFRILPNGWYIKGGDFLPDYGWRLDDHTTYTRGGNLSFIPGLMGNNGLIFIPNYKDIGVEVGGYIENLFITAGIFNGSGETLPIDFSKQKAFAAKLEYMGTAGSMNFRLGASGYSNTRLNPFLGNTREFKMGGFTAGIGAENLTILGEIDWTKNQFNVFSGLISDGVNTMAAYAEIDYRAIQGVWLIGKFDMFDPLEGVADDDTSPATNTLKRVTLGMEFFPYSFVEVRPQYRLNIETPAIQNDEALVQMHVWF